MNQSIPEQPIGGIYRRSEGRVAAGVASGIADRLGVHPVYVRAAFVVLTFVWGVGVLVYLGVWAATIDQSGVSQPLVDRPGDRQLVGLGVAFVGVLVMLRNLLPWPGDRLMWPVLGIGILAAVALDRWTDVARLTSPERQKTRLVLGAVLAFGGLALLGDFDPALLAPALLAMVLAAAGLAIAFGPWLYRAVSDLAQERAERIRQRQREEMASHLHDSVLQTLAMIQRTDDPKRIVTLARAQERELRRWLFESEADPGADSFAGAVQTAAAKVEADFDVVVEVVTVGDCELDDHLRALAAAGSEAIVNAAKHAGVDRVSVFLEVSDSDVELFVSDQGAGFDLDDIAADRRGITDSITRRVERHGGKAEIESVVGSGTEVQLTMPRMASVRGGNRDDGLSR